MNQAAIKTFIFEENSSTTEKTTTTTTTTVLTLSLSRKGASYLLIHSEPTSTASPKERQYTIINALAAEDPIPSLALGTNRVRIWLKTGKHSRGESEVGGENWMLLEKLIELGIIKDTGIKSNQGLNSYPLVEILLNFGELAEVCWACGDFESSKNVERYKRCNRCKQAYYCSAVCQNKDWKSNHKASCLDEPNDDAKSLEEARRRSLMRLYSRTVPPLLESGMRSKMD